MYGCEHFTTFASSGGSVYGVLPDGKMVEITSVPRERRAHWLAQVLSQHQQMKRHISKLIELVEHGDKYTAENRASILSDAEKFLCWRPE